MKIPYAIIKIKILAEEIEIDMNELELFNLVYELQEEIENTILLDPRFAKFQLKVDTE